MQYPLDLSLAHSIQACRQLTASAHSNFVPAFALLPADKRQAMEILYAYTRFTDDSADLPNFTPEDTAMTVSPRQKQQRFNQWVGTLEAVLGKIGDVHVPQIDPQDEQIFQQIAEQFSGCDGLVLLPALKMIVDKYNIPREPLFHLLDGIERDMDSPSFATFDDSLEYCHQVATSVGFASLAIWGTTEPLFSETVVKAAEACGAAFQWTNIIRDLREDYQNGRIYLPQSELQRFGLTDEQLGLILDEAVREARGKQFEEKFLQLMDYQLNRCEVYYETSQPLYHLIHRDSRRTFGLMWNYYYSLYRKMRKNPWLVTRRTRVRLSFSQKFRLWFRWRLL
ncbi:MAG: squalene/phytoene synthase family protein [Planctomycetaceae bacterium]|nr:squalene/phytoene synthase family protein [Planctomycetaceae bacterium]